MSEAQSPLTKIWLVRHGEPDAAANGRCYGRLDFGLSREGQRQVERVARYLAREPLSAIYASPLRRALLSAEIVAAPHARPVETIDDLCEMNFGDMEGLTYEEIEQRFPSVFRTWMERPTETQFPNGESFSIVRARVAEAGKTLRARHPSQSIALITHSSVIRILVAEALSVPPAAIFRIGQRHAGVTLINYAGEIPSVELVNLPIPD